MIDSRFRGNDKGVMALEPSYTFAHFLEPTTPENSIPSHTAPRLARECVYGSRSANRGSIRKRWDNRPRFGRGSCGKALSFFSHQKFRALLRAIGRLEDSNTR